MSITLLLRVRIGSDLSVAGKEALYFCSPNRAGAQCALLHHKLEQEKLIYSTHLSKKKKKVAALYSEVPCSKSVTSVSGFWNIRSIYCQMQLWDRIAKGSDRWRTAPAHTGSSEQGAPGLSWCLPWAQRETLPRDCGWGCGIIVIPLNVF